VQTTRWPVLFFSYIFRFKYASTARRNNSAIGAPVLRDSFFNRSTSSSGSQTVVRFFTVKISYVCHSMSSKIRIPAENNCVVAAVDTRKWKSKTNRFFIRPAGPWPSLVTAGLSARGWGTGGTKEKARGPTQGSIDARNFGEFDFCGLRLA
jgi:hypothetical protein